MLLETAQGVWVVSSSQYIFTSLINCFWFLFVCLFTWLALSWQHSEMAEPENDIVRERRETGWELGQKVQPSRPRRTGSGLRHAEVILVSGSSPRHHCPVTLLCNTRRRYTTRCSISLRHGSVTMVIAAVTVIIYSSTINKIRFLYD